MKTLEITTKIGCKNNCYYCPQDKIIKNYRSSYNSLSFITFIKYLKNIPTTTKLHFSGFSEPFLNDSSIYMMDYAVKKGYDIGIYTTTMGMTEETVKRLQNIKVDPFVVHIPDIKQTFDFEIWAYNVKLMDKAGIDFSFIEVGTEDKSDIVLEYLLNTDKKVEFQEIVSRAGNYSGVPYEHKDGIVSCDRVIQNVLLPDGRVVLCCMDYSLDYVLGDLNYQNLNEIKPLQDTELCRKCFRGTDEKAMSCV